VNRNAFWTLSSIIVFWLLYPLSGGAEEPPRPQSALPPSADFQPLLSAFAFREDVTAFVETVGAEKRDESTLRVRVPAALFFRRDRADLTPDGKTALTFIIKILWEYHPQMLRVESFTDDRPTFTPQYPSNWFLSAARAVNIGLFCVEDLGLPPERLQTAGRGSYAPLAPNDTPEGQALNSRIEIVFIPE
jgi:chemotaxis protein MotB